ncbi:MAG: Arc family DNA binding domain-containing protein [Calditrichaeota bacterium]|nr:MAG: Arc family DNA binding domain-containing protein [Calditrichota bacterium]MBL1203828.1 Arc family DNA binding domain-containing protein [Calditrichota bacterium]NOG43659.1 Arc family DNA binding domain-containing protein [Calditrichota bacterium]
MPSTEKKKSLILRINPQLWVDLNKWAEDELRSLNGQIEFVLREAVRKRKNESEESKG